MQGVGISTASAGVEDVLDTYMIHFVKGERRKETEPGKIMERR